MLCSCRLVKKIVFLPEAAVPVKKRCRSAGTEKDEVSFEALVDDESSAFKGSEYGAFRLWEPKSNFDKRVGYERGIDGNQDLFKAGVLKRRDGNCFAVAREVGKFLGWDEIYLVQYLDDGLRRNSKLG
jgi:hypothetical protein